jgi:surfactin synthase thioesterase subunit
VTRPLLVNFARARGGPADEMAADDQRPVLLCLPQAGSGCGQFRYWQRLAGQAVTVIGVQLPGREERWLDPMPESVDEVTGAVAGALPSVPVVVYGHSFGGLLGYEIARRLCLIGRPPRALVVAACGAPGRWAGAGRDLLSDEAEQARLLAANGVDLAGLDDDLREFAAQALRADALLSTTFRLPARPRVDCEIHAWAGAGDDIITASQIGEWRDYSSAAVHVETFDGGHQFAFEQVAEIVPRLVRLCTSGTQLANGA